MPHHRRVQGLQSGKWRQLNWIFSSIERELTPLLCSTQRSAVLGNKIEMEITNLVEKNPSLLRLGLHLEFNDARHRVAAHLQRNIDRSKLVVAVGSCFPPRTIVAGSQRWFCSLGSRSLWISWYNEITYIYIGLYSRMTRVYLTRV